MIEIVWTKFYEPEDRISDISSLREPFPNEGERVAEVTFVVKEGHESEFDTLLKVVLAYFSSTHHFYGFFCDSFPRKKSRLRTYKGFSYGLKKQIPSSDYLEKEFDLPDDQSVFLAIIRFREENSSLFLDHLIDSSFIAGMFLERSDGLSPSQRERMLDVIFEKNVRIDSIVTVDTLKAMALVADAHTLAFRIGVDEQNQEYLALFGKPEYLERQVNALTTHLEKHFYLRRRQPWMDQAGS